MAGDSDREARELLGKLREMDFGDNLSVGLVAESEELARENDFSESDEKDFPDFSNLLTSSKPGPSPGPGSVGIPKLPARAVLDLSQPTVKTPDIPEFTIPSVLRVNPDNTEITYPSDLTQVDWLVIARKSKILNAYTMGEASRGPPQADSAALDWMVPVSTDYFDSLELTGEVTSEVTYTAETASYVRAGFDKQEASVGIPFASASFEREHKERQAAASHKKTLHLFGRWYYPRVKLKLKYCAAVSERFQTAIRAALDSYDQTKDINPLLRVFEKYGTAVPNEVVLGGEMLLEHQESYQGTVDEKQVENVISAAVSIKTAKAQGSVGFSFQNAEGGTVTSDQMSKKIEFRVRGGDSTKTSDPQQWPATVKPAKNWEVIGRSGVTPILDWLPDDLRARAMAVWPKLPVRPAIWELQDTALARDHIGSAERAQFVLGARKVLDGQQGARGAVQLVCGTSMTPELGRGDAVGGAASFHRDESGGDARINTSSVCLPVPAGHRYAATAPDTWAGRGKAAVRFAIAETNLTLDKWRGVEMQRIPAGPHLVSNFQASADGFVFCSVEALNNEEHGHVTCEVDDVVIAAASVHNYAPWDGWLRNASFCAPFTKGSVVKVIETNTTRTSGHGYLGVRTWQILSTSPAWKFKNPQPFTLGAWVTPETDGFLNGVITGTESGGSLRLDCVKDRELHDVALASATIHSSPGKNNRYNSHASAMLPVRKGYMIFTERKHSVGEAPQAQAYWTGVVPV
jgi:hypothetical protein